MCMKRWWIPLLVVQFLASIVLAQDAPPALTSAVEMCIKKKGASEQPVFRHAVTDLNDDKHADAIVLLTGEHWCGSGGCTMLIFQGTPNGFKFVSRSTVTREPIRVSAGKERGWKTLIVQSKGVGDVLMPFNGTSYPLESVTATTG